jgi:hypothetical protein
MNEILNYLLLVAILGLAAVWITAVFCFVLYSLGDVDER